MVQSKIQTGPISRLTLSAEETRRLADILDRDFDPPPALAESLKRLADPERRVPELAWAGADREATANDEVDPATETKWTELARRYREKPNLRGSSEKLNALVREFREEFPNGP